MIHLTSLPASLLLPSPPHPGYLSKSMNLEKIQANFLSSFDHDHSIFIMAGRHVHTLEPIPFSRVENGKQEEHHP